MAYFRMSDERVMFLHAYWKAKGRGAITLVEIYESCGRSTHCTTAGAARDALQRLEKIGLAKRLKNFSVTHRGVARGECWEFL